MTSEQMRDLHRPITIRQALHEIDGYLADDAGAYRYDVDAGLTRLNQALTVDDEAATPTGHMTSDITPEFAVQVGFDAWTLSWLPNRILTREQALRGMQLDEILSDPDGLVAQEDAMEMAELLAAEIDVPVQMVVLLLAQRMAARGEQSSNTVRAHALKGFQSDKN